MKAQWTSKDNEITTELPSVPSLVLDYNENEPIISKPSDVHKLSIFTTAAFIVAQTLGCGVLALPNALANTGWIGLPLLFFMCALSGVCGVVLGKSWLILREVFPEYRGHVRHPFAVLGFHACGRWGKYAVVYVINASLIGVSTVFLLLAAENCNALIRLNMSFVSESNEYRIWLLICILFVLPLTWHETPKNIWPFAFVAAVSSFVALSLLLIKLVIDFDGDVPKRKVKVSSFFAAFGAMGFTFGDIAIFPTLQTDMKKPALFHVSVILAYIFVFMLYVSLPAVGFFSYGNNVEANVLKNLSSSSPVTKAIKILITINLFYSIFMAINPVMQQMEEWLSVPAGHLTLRRCVVRSSVVLFILALAEGIPHFGLFLNLVGSSTTCLLTFVFPCLFYLKLQSGLSLHVKAFLVEILFLGGLAGVISTYFAIKAIVDELFS